MIIIGPNVTLKTNKMKPTEAKFDGEKGISLGGGRVFKFLRGKPKPNICDWDFRNHLIWWECDEGPIFLYCNEDGDFFELDFKLLPKTFFYFD